MDVKIFLSPFPLLVTVSVEVASEQRTLEATDALGESANSGGNNSDSEERKRNNKQVGKYRKSE